MELFPLLILPIPLDFEREWRRQWWKWQWLYKVFTRFNFSHCTIFSFGEDNTVLYLTSYFDNFDNFNFVTFYACIWWTLCYIRPRPASAMDIMTTFTAARITAAACWLLAAVKQKVETLSRFVTFEPAPWSVARLKPLEKLSPS